MQDTSRWSLPALCLGLLLPMAGTGRADATVARDYDRLAQMLQQRYALLERDAPDLARGQGPVGQVDLNRLRRAFCAIQAGFTVAPAALRLAAGADRAAAFPPAVAFDTQGRLVPGGAMEGIGHNGLFTRIPPGRLASRQGIFSNRFTDGPVLRLHVAELHTAIARLRYVCIPGGAGRIFFTAQGQPNYRLGCGVGATSSGAGAAAAAAYERGQPVILEGQRPSITVSVSRGRDRHAVAIARTTSRAGVTGLPTSRPGVVRFYALAGNPGEGLQGWRFEDFDDPVADRMWTLWCVTAPATQSTVLSTSLGAAYADLPPWPDFLTTATEPDEFAAWALLDVVAVFEALFDDPPLEASLAATVRRDGGM